MNARKLCWLDIREAGEARAAVLDEAVHQRIDGIVSDDPADLGGLPPTVRKILLYDGPTAEAPETPNLPGVLLAAKLAGHGHVIVDGTVIETDRLRTPGPTTGVDLWWSGKHHHHGGNIQVVSAPDDGWPLWTSDVRPGREHDSTALRASGALPVPADWTTDGGEILTDLGYEGLRDQVTIPAKRAKGGGLTLDQQNHNRTHNPLRAVGERANALLKVTFRALRNVTLDPWKIGQITKAALVILHTEHGRTT
ncbi:transposase, IS4 family [Frankia sp. CcI6]|nr:transposase, IS4 family [Frankia sp. CcI6]KFB02761.1 transposase, IS4 family [Frankia sp. Allo2]OHV49417.1 hypothetical protein CgIS1_21180 [Frankia sp. CgIS1]